MQMIPNTSPPKSVLDELDASLESDSCDALLGRA
jgi:hypothetical protein